MKAFFMFNRNGSTVVQACYYIACITWLQPIMAGMQIHAKAPALIRSQIGPELSRKFSSWFAMIIHP